MIDLPPFSPLRKAACEAPPVFRPARCRVALPACVLGLAVYLMPFGSFAQTSDELARVAVGDATEVPAWIANRARLHLVSAGGRQTLTSDIERDPYTKFEWDIRLGSVALPRGGRVTLELQFIDQGAG